MRILVVEHEKTPREKLKASLEAECFAVDAVRDGEEGSYLARVNDYDVIILDNRPPRKTGLDVCKEIRAAGKLTPIIMMSVDPNPSTKVEALNSGANDYVTKPFSFQELVARVKVLLRRSNQVENSVLKLDDLVLNRNKQTVTRGKKKIDLTKKEFMILEYMMRNPGTVLSRMMIMEHVWDTTVDLLSCTVESHVLNLRHKIDTKGKRHLIHTITGRGYILDENP